MVAQYSIEFIFKPFPISRQCLNFNMNSATREQSIPAIHTYFANNMHGQPETWLGVGQAALSREAPAAGHHLERRVFAVASVPCRICCIRGHNSQNR